MVIISGIKETKRVLKLFDFVNYNLIIIDIEIGY